MNEMTISIKDLLFRICLRWRLILVWMLAMGVVMAGLGYVKNVQKVNEAQAAYEAQQEAGGSAEGEAPVVVPKLQVIHVKYSILGLIGGVFVACCYVAVRYMACTKLRVKEDMPEVFNVVLLGSVKRPVAPKKFLPGIDRMITRIFQSKDDHFTEENRVEMICTDIRLAMKKAEMQKLYLTGSCDDAEIEELREVFAKKLAGELPGVDSGRSVLYIPESLENLTEADGVVLFEKTGVSKYEEILRVLELCKRYEIPVIGSVIIEA